MTQNDLASHLGVTRQSLHRELTLLKSAGIVEKPNERWIIRDIRRLQHLAQGQQLALGETR
ncbi:MAG: hypothetical protein B7Y90_05525 [Alphaproteobacteria bacterium 32-64-14]|nr:MAG: hypothetical protein B7Y90_05525 [Alphaproteobacteria bacterium 32-64-14]